MNLKDNVIIRDKLANSSTLQSIQYVFNSILTTQVIYIRVLFCSTQVNSIFEDDTIKRNIVANSSQTSLALSNASFIQFNHRIMHPISLVILYL